MNGRKVKEIRNACLMLNIDLTTPKGKRKYRNIKKIYTRGLLG